MSTRSQRFRFHILFVLIFTGFGSASAHPTDSLPLPPIMDIITGDLPQPSDAYFGWVLNTYAPAEGQGISSTPQAIEYYRAVLQAGDPEGAYKGLLNHFTDYLLFVTTDPNPEPRAYHYETIWHLARMRYLMKDYEGAADHLGELEDWSAFQDSLMTEAQYLRSVLPVPCRK